ncbi:hypothetical protein AB6A40_005263 [Gnathostoma spinigerum]|uniref:Peroxisomal targeting signal 1 receptor n=1 Tax=Gnathostoma spinigerum TaxID=75299 RepID=A0ABD6EEY1_9BILA
MDALIAEDCSQPNALVKLSKDIAETNAVLPTDIGLLPLIPSTFSDKLKDEYLSSVTKTIPMPSTFMMNELLDEAEGTCSDQNTLRNWVDEYSAKSDKRVQSWVEQYTRTQASSLDPPQSQCSEPAESSLLPSEFLTDFEKVHQFSMADSMVDELVTDFIEKNLTISDDRTDEKLYENSWNTITRESDVLTVDSCSVRDTYAVQSNNPFLHDKNVLESGEESMKAGLLSNAILQFEAAIQQNPKNSKAWYMLGICQAENERDDFAITAFRKAQELDPKNLNVYLALSVSYANESMENHALIELGKWLINHPVYEISSSDFSSHSVNWPFLDQALFRKVEQGFLSAANQQGIQPDENLQNAIGILYNLNGDYERAIDAIRSALSCNPNNPKMWNRLGATLANSEQIGEAILAYNRSLQLYPASARTRYNLGIACCHLESYYEAVGHFISALEIQRRNSSAINSSVVWPAVLRAVFEAELPHSDELIAAVTSRDLSALIKLYRHWDPHSPLRT